MTEERLKELCSQTEKHSLTDNVKAGLHGSFIKLPCGETHYQLAGKGEKVVLVHGYATPYYIYDKIFDFLVERGFEVLRYDLLGRGFSERVKADYTPSLFARQLDEITEALFGEEAFYLFGTSMGGSIVTAYAARRPQKVKKLFLLAPAGMDFEKPFYMKLCAKPILGEIIFKFAGGPVLLKRSCAELIYSKDETDYYLEKFAESIRYKGFNRCVLSSLRHTLLNQAQTIPNYEEVGRSEIPVCVIWGTDDKTMPYYQVEQMKQLLPQMKLYTFEGSGHIFLFDEGERTCEVIASELGLSSD